MSTANYPILTDSETLKEVVNCLTENIPIKTQGKCEQQTIFEILIRAATQKDSIENTSKVLTNVPTSKNIYYHLGKYSDPNSLESDLNAALQSRIPDGIQKGKHKVAIDFNLIPYYGEPSASESPYIYRSQAKSGTCSFYAYATLYVIKKNQRVTLAIKAVRQQDTLVAVITYLLALIKPNTFKIERLLLDREFFCVPVIRWLQALDIPFEMPAIIRGKHGGTRQLIRGRRSYKTTYTLKSDKYGSVTFQVWIVCTYKKGKRRAHGREFFVYAVYNIKLSLHSIHDDYRLRFGIESSYRMKNQCRIKTTIKNPTLRFLFVALAFLIINIWISLLWHHLGALRKSSKKAFSHVFTLKQMLEFLRQSIDRNYGVAHEVYLT
ncbi:MAG: ISH3 family transposase [Nostoc sp. ChiQUE01a]|nr:ISH3 family transposase [Nostoc sp. ChiQUE01a]